MLAQSASQPVKLVSAATHPEESASFLGNDSALTLENVPNVPGRLLDLLNETKKLADEIQTVLRRIGFELERLGTPHRASPVFSRHPACPELSSLSPRESEIVQIFMEGSRVSTIARRLCISQHTVRNHLQSVYRKLGVSSQAELIEKLNGLARLSAVPGGLV